MPPRARAAGTLPILLLALSSAAACRQAHTPVARLSSDSGQVKITSHGFRELTLTFEILRELPEADAAALVFVHLLSDDGQLVRTFDHPLPSQWWIGDKAQSRFVVHLSGLADTLTSGRYRLTAGLYDTVRGKYAIDSRLPAAGRNEFEVAQVIVTPDSDSRADVLPEEDWVPEVAATDRQVIGARYLRPGRQGRIALEGSSAPKRFFVRLNLPGYSTDMATVEVRGHPREPVVELGGTCLKAAASVKGSGIQEAILEANPDLESPTECVLTVDANFTIEPRDGSEPRSVQVQALSWD